MKMIQVTTLDHIKLADLTEIWNRCWGGYYYDMSYTLDHMKGWCALSQVCLQHSLAILVEKQIVGFALLSMDGNEGWIAGACVDPDYRRRGFFTTLMRLQLDLATRVGLKRVYLEVLEQNPALKIYQSLGFERVRQLYIYRAHNRFDCPQRPREKTLESSTLEQYFSYRARALFNPAWQRREGYLRRHSHLWSLINSSGTAGALFGGDRSTLLLDAWSTNASGAQTVIFNVFQRSGDLSLTNQPEDWIAELLRSQGIRSSAQQFEMCIELT